MSISKKITSLLSLNQGIRVKSYKAVSNKGKVITPPLFEHYYISLTQRDGDQSDCLVQVGDRVLAGQIITKPTSSSALYRHAPTSGIVTGIVDIVETHPSQIKTKAIQIKSDGLDQPAPFIRDQNQENQLDDLDITALLKKIERAGICGMGGAGFPTEKKLNLKQTVSTLIVNGAECEPYVTCDDLLMQTYSDQIIKGAQAIAKIIGATKIIIAIERDKTKAIQKITEACNASNDPRFKVQTIPVIYPIGSRQKLAEYVLGVKISAQKRAYEYDFICHNVSTVKACHDAIFYNRPLISRLVTISGDALGLPSVYHLRVGTTLFDALQAAKYHKGADVIFGGTMMGFSAADPTKNTQTIRGETTAILAFEQLGIDSPAQNCIRCAKCADHCPVSLLPQQMYFYTKNKQYDKAKQYRITDCIECGVCTYVCPSNIALTTYFQHGKAEIWQLENKKLQSERSKQLFEAKNKRLQKQEEEKLKRQELKRKKMALANRTSQSTQDANDLIQQALNRANAKKEQAASNPTKDTNKL